MYLTSNASLSNLLITNNGGKLKINRKSTIFVITTVDNFIFMWSQAFIFSYIKLEITNFPKIY